MKDEIESNYPRPAVDLCAKCGTFMTAAMQCCPDCGAERQPLPPRGMASLRLWQQVLAYFTVIVLVVVSLLDSTVGGLIAVGLCLAAGFWLFRKVLTTLLKAQRRRR